MVIKSRKKVINLIMAEQYTPFINAILHTDYHLSESFIIYEFGGSIYTKVVANVANHLDNGP